MLSCPASFWIASIGTFTIASREQNVCLSLWLLPFADGRPARFSTLLIAGERSVAVATR